MNATIAKIVNLLFEDLAETEETIAIREEILQNCQERYQDLREAGISEDDAIHAVIESLNGMEEMLSEYPRKESKTVNMPEPEKVEDAEQSDGEEENRCWTFDPGQSPIHEIRMENMASADVYVQPSHDHLVHVEVECDNPNLTLMTGMEDGVLTVALSEQKEEDVRAEIKFSLQEGFDLSSIGKFFEKLARKFTSDLSGVEITLSIPNDLCPNLQIGTASGCVTLEPMNLQRLLIGTASGDVELNSLHVQNEVRVTSASGDITVTSVEAQHMQLSSTSGDIEADSCLVRENVRLNTTSGDIGWCRQCKTLNASSISGDLTLEGSAESISFRTVSGDVELNLCGGSLTDIRGNTTSGDVNVHLPEATQAAVHCSTVSGDICNHAGSIPGAAVTVKLSTVSGDIKVN